MLRSSVLLFSWIAAAKAQESCSDKHETIRHGGIKYVFGEEGMKGSVYAHCVDGTFNCYIANLIPGKADDRVPCKEAGSHRNLLMISSNKRYRWPRNTVCYRPISNIFNAKKKGLIQQAFDNIQQNTNIRFLPIDQCSGSVCGNCQHALKFIQDDQGCWSFIGYLQRANQQIGLGLTDNCFHGINTIVHELGHALGFRHEHIHKKRRVIILEDEIRQGWDPKDYKKLPEADNDWDETPYDPLSTMHYDFHSGICFPIGDASSYCDVEETTNCTPPTKDDCDTVKTAAMQKRKRAIIGLSPKDIIAFNKAYPGEKGVTPTTKPTPTPPTTPATTPATTPPTASGRVCDASDPRKGNCCTVTKSCDVGQGDCDFDSECLDGLKCGSNNCLRDFKWGALATDCCYKPVCDRTNRNKWTCCTEAMPCAEEQGDCDKDSECLGDLKCGRNNCRRDFNWGPVTLDCCYQP